MEKTSFISEIKGKEIWIIIVLLIPIVGFKVYKSFISNSIETSGQLGLPASNDSVDVPVYSATTALVGKQSIIATRLQQIEQLNSGHSFKVHADGVILDQAQEDLPWESSADNPLNPAKLIYNQAITAGLLNPLLLATPYLAPPEGYNIPQEELKVLLSIKNISYQPGRKEAQASIELSPAIRNDNDAILKQSDFMTSYFNALDLGFKYVQIDQNDSKNLAAASPANEAIEIVSVFHADYCNPADYENTSAAKCNQMTISGDFNIFRISSLPAQATFLFWKSKPEPQDAADFTFKVLFN